MCLWQVSSVSGEFGATEQLQQEASKWAMRLAKERHNLHECRRKIDAINDQVNNGETRVGVYGQRLG